MTSPDRVVGHLEISNLRKSYGEFVALKGVDLTVAKGEVVVLIGSSGSGKSTLLRCVNRLEEPNSGSIRLEGREILGEGVRLPELRRTIGMVFQSFNLYPHLSALGNITLAMRKAAGVPKVQAEARAMELLEEVGLAAKARSYPEQLSGGQQQRVAIARALALDPHLMLFDEPTSALDPELVGSVLEVIRGLKKRHMTMLIVTHELGFAREAADRIVMMDHGEIVEIAPPRDFFSNPGHQRTREFLRQFNERS